MSTIEIKVPVRGDKYIQKMRGTFLRASAMYCVGVVEQVLWYRIDKTLT